MGVIAKLGSPDAITNLQGENLLALGPVIYEISIKIWWPPGPSNLKGSFCI